MNRLKMLMCGVAALIVAAFIVIVIILIIYVHRIDIMLSVLAIVWAINFVFVVYILGSDRHINTKACWCGAIAFLWTIGCLLFLIFGTNPLRKTKWKQRFETQKNFNKFEDYSFMKNLLKRNDDEANLLKYSFYAAFKPVYENNEITILKSNIEIYEQYVNLIRSAKKFIHFETYLIRDGFFLRTVFCELINKANTGIKVRFLYDWYGSLGKFNKEQLEELKAAGVEVAVFNYPGNNVFKGATNYRLHHKALIIDNSVAIYGGSNIGNEYLAMSPNKYYWRDMNIVLKGEIVNSLNIEFINDWMTFTDKSVNKTSRDELVNNLDQWLKIDHSYNKESTKAQLSISSPNYAEKGVSNTMISLFIKAKRSIKLVSPYFLPTEPTINALKIAGQNGVDVKIIVPGKRDNKDFIIPMNRSQYRQLFEANIKVYEYNGFIHSKYIIVDDQFIYTTSANFDFRSMIINFENGILIDSKETCSHMLKIFEADLDNTRQVGPRDVDKYNTLYNRVRLSLLNLYKPLL